MIWRERRIASSSESQTTCATPLRPWVSGPPSRSMSTSSPVALRTTSGPVTKMRPSGPSTTTSVRAGPYAAPPADGPTTSDNWRTRPLAMLLAANTRAIPSSESTPSPSRAPPERQIPTIGAPSATASWVAEAIARQPSAPSAPPCDPGSVAKAIASMPAMSPRATVTPSPWSIWTQESKSASNRSAQTSATAGGSPGRCGCK